MDHEKEQVEVVFGLTGGELADEPWEPFKATDGDQFSEGETSDRETFKYWYEGVPDHAGKTEFKDLYASGVTYRTVVEDCLWGLPPKTLQDQGSWKRVSYFRNSGEVECSWKNVDNDEDESLIAHRDERPCQLCEAKEGQPHGYIYLGDGWCEVVYRKFEREVECNYIDTCLSDYLQDHHCRDGEGDEPRAWFYLKWTLDKGK